MSADKRTVSTDALETLGTIITEREKRDAIHLAVIPVEAGEYLNPAWHVYLRDGKAYSLKGNATRESQGDPVGIVDPFLAGGAEPGQRFWLVVYPRVITSLRHVWTHPAIPDEIGASPSAREESRMWLENYAVRLFGGDPYYGESDVDALDLLVRCAEDGHFNTEIEGPGRSPTSEFWMHFERYMGREAKSKPDFFRCGC